MTTNSESTTVTKKELVNRVAHLTGSKRVIAQKVIQTYLEEIMSELSKGNRLEFRGFGVFETTKRDARMAQNPKTLEKVRVPAKRFVRFKAGNIMKEKIHQNGG